MLFLWQEEAMKAQEQLNQKMTAVGVDVDSTRSSVEDVPSSLSFLASWKKSRQAAGIGIKYNNYFFLSTI